MLVSTKGRPFVLNNDLIITAKKRQEIDNFTEGYIDNYALNTIPPNALYRAVNVVMTLKGSIETRHGVDPLLLTTLGNLRVRDLEFFITEAGVVKLMASYDNKIGYVNTATYSISDVITGLSSSTGDTCMLNIRSKLYSMTGNEAMKVFDGTTVWNAGLTAPTVAPTSAISISAPKDVLTATDSATAGNPSGAYMYKVSFTTAAGESGPGPSSTSVTVTLKSLLLKNIPVGPAGTTARNIYRTKAYGIMYYLLTTLADNTTVIYTDNTLDASLGTQNPIASKNVNGDYYYRYSFVYGERGESSPSPASTLLTIVNGQVALTAIAVGGAGVTQRKVWRSVAGESADTLRLLVTLDNNTATIFTDNILDADLTTTLDISLNIPPNFTFGIIKEKSQTLWAVDTINHPTRVWLSKALFPEVVPEDNYVNLPSYGESITALAEYNDFVYVFMKTAIYKISGDTIDTIAVLVVSKSIGCISRYTLQYARLDVVFLSKDGLYTMSRVLLSSSETTIDIKPVSDKVNASIKRANKNALSKCRSFVFDEGYGLALPYDTATQNNLILYFNMDLKNWVTWKGKLGYGACFVVGDLLKTNTYKLYIGTSTQTGQIYQYPSNGYADDGDPIDSYIILAPMNGDVPEAIKRWKSFFVEVEASGDWLMYAWYRKNPYEDDAVGWIQKTISLSPFSASTVVAEYLPVFYPVLGFYPVTGFATVAPAAKILIKTKGKSISGQSKYIQFKIGNGNQLRTYFKLYKFILYYRAKKPKVQ